MYKINIVVKRDADWDHHGPWSTVKTVHIPSNQKELDALSEKSFTEIVNDFYSLAQSSSEFCLTTNDYISYDNIVRDISYYANETSACLYILDLNLAKFDPSMIKNIEAKTKESFCFKIVDSHCIIIREDYKYGDWLC